MINNALDSAAASPSDAQIVAALADARGRTIAELAHETGLLPAAVRSILRELAQRGLAWRTFTGPLAGRWRLTPRGLSEAGVQREASEL